MVRGIGQGCMSGARGEGGYVGIHCRRTGIGNVNAASSAALCKRSGRNHSLLNGSQPRTASPDPAPAKPPTCGPTAHDGSRNWDFPD